MSSYRIPPGEIKNAERVSSTLHPPAGWLTWAALACLVVGVVGFVGGLLLAPGRAWAALLVNTLYWTGLGAAAIAVMATFNIAHSWWGRIFQRILTGLAAFLPFGLIPLGALYFGRHYLYWWANEPTGLPWLSAGAMWARDILILAAFSALAWWTLYRALRPDLGAMVEEGTVERRGFAGFLTRNWQGDEKEQLRSMRFERTMAPINVLAYVFGFSILAIDLEMTVQPEFRSTMFPVLYFIGEYLAAFAAAAVLSSFWRRVDAIRPLIAGQNVRDLANMMWGAVIFWGYVTWSQYFVIWMGNLPPEAEWVVIRWRLMPWEALAFTTLALTFIAPFLLLFARGLKWNPNTLAGIALLPLLGVLLNRFLHVFPGVAQFARLGPTDFGIVEVLVTIGFVGAVALPYLWLMRRVPVFPVEDPLYLRALATRGVEV